MWFLNDQTGNCVGFNWCDPVFAVDHSAKFFEAAKKGNLIPLHRSIFSDHLTPVLAYRCLVKEDDRDAPSFLFESVEPGFQSSNVVRPLLFAPIHKEYQLYGYYENVGRVKDSATPGNFGSEFRKWS